MSSEPNPDHIRSMVAGYQKTAALRAGIDLHVFTAISQGASTVEAISAKCHASHRGIRILCDFLTIEGLLVKENFNYKLTPDSEAFLVEQSPRYMGNMLKFLLAPRFIEAAGGLTQTVRQGATTLGDGIAGDEAEEWVEFARHMQPMAAGQSEFIAKLVQPLQPKRVLDIAAGHGLYGIAVALRVPEANIVAQDWPTVLTVAESNAKASGISDRYHLLPGNAFDVDLVGGFDVVLIPNFLHHFDEATCVSFLRKVRAGLNPGGRLVTLEFIPNEDRVSPARAAAFAMTMLLQTPAGDAYTKTELFRMLNAAGYSAHEVVDVPGSPEKVVVSRVT